MVEVKGWGNMIVKTSKTLMTEGSILKKIIHFAFPIFLGSLFQQMYNTVDSLIVGNFLGSNALAAVSSWDCREIGSPKQRQV